MSTTHHLQQHRHRHGSGFDRQQFQRWCRRRLGHQRQLAGVAAGRGDPGSAASPDHQPDSGGHDADFLAGHPQERPVDLPVVAECARHADRVQCADRHQQRLDGLHRHGGSGAPVGTYSVTVSALAQAQQLLSKPFTGDGTAAVGTGTLQVSLGGTSFNVDIGSGDDTLDGIAAAINSASGNPGITATVHPGYRRRPPAAVLDANRRRQHHPGQRDRRRERPGGPDLQQSRATTELHQAVGGSGRELQYRRRRGHQPQQYHHQRAERRDAESDRTDHRQHGPATLTVSTDTSTIESNISAFVTAYNTLAGSLSSARRLRCHDRHRRPDDGQCPALRHSESDPERALQCRQYRLADLQLAGQRRHHDQQRRHAEPQQQHAVERAVHQFQCRQSLFSGTSGVAANLNSQITDGPGRQRRDRHRQPDRWSPRKTP